MPDKVTPAPDGPVAQAAMLQHSIRTLGILPTLPQAGQRARAAANEPKSSLAQLARIVESDPALAATFLSLANSRLYRVGGGVDSLPQAVARLGLRESNNLLRAVGLKSMLGRIPGSHRPIFENLWRHCVLTGILCRSLNRLVPLGFQGEEFTAGLVHDLGRVLFAIVLQERFPGVDPVDFRECDDLLSREQRILQTDHCAFGAWFAVESGFPASLASVMQHHHRPADTSSHQTLVALVAAADDMANFLHREESAQKYDLENNLGWLCLRDLLDSTQRSKIVEAAPRLMTAADRESREALRDSREALRS